MLPSSVSSVVFLICFPIPMAQDSVQVLRNLLLGLPFILHCSATAVWIIFHLLLFCGLFWFCPPRRTDARKHALEVERQRAAKVASLPPPPPHPFEVCIRATTVITISGVPYILVWLFQQDIQSYLHTTRRVVQQAPREWVNNVLADFLLLSLGTLLISCCMWILFLVSLFVSFISLTLIFVVNVSF